MQHIVFVLCALILTVPIINTVDAEVIAPEPQMTLKEKLLSSSVAERKTLVYEEIRKLSLEYDVNVEQIINVLQCENAEFDPTLQSRLKYKWDNSKWNIRKGDRELSFGLAMIHLPSHPSITVEEATDPEYALRYIVTEFFKGKQTQWSCYKKLYT